MSTMPDKNVQASVLLGGDLSKLTPEQRIEYYVDVCASLGLNPLTRPFEYLVLNSKLVLYAKKDCTEQIRQRDKISITITGRDMIDGVYVVTAKADGNGRVDEATGAVSIEGLKGDVKANAMMKAETKAKRRVTLSIAGLGILDESEVDSIPHALIVPERHEEATLADVQAQLAAKTTDKGAAVLSRMHAPVTPPPQPGPTTPPPKPAEAPVPPTQPEPNAAVPDAAFIWRIPGKHMGESVRTIDHSYLVWTVKQNNNPEHVAEATKELERRAAMLLPGMGA